MHLVNYELPLPADYDMGIIHERVRSRGSVTDDWADLGFKAYLVTDVATGAAANSYAPFYLWRAGGGMHRFMWEGGFSNIVRDFGRPPAHHWASLAVERGGAFGGGAQPAFAVRRRTVLPDRLDPAAPIRGAVDELLKLTTGTDHHTLHIAVAGIDPHRWELVQFSLWTEAPPEHVVGTRFEVLHLSAPELDQVHTGREW